MASRRGEKSENVEELPKVKITKESLKEALSILAYLKPYRFKFLMGMVFIVLSALSTMIFPFLVGKMISVVSDGKASLPTTASTSQMTSDIQDWLSNSRWSVDFILLLLFIQLAVQMFFSFMRIYTLTEVGEKSLADLRKDVFKKIVSMPMRFFSERRVGELSSRISSDLSQIQDTISFTLAEFLRGLVTLVVGMFLIFFISTKLALVMLSIVPVIAILAVVFGGRIRKMARKGQDQLADSGNIINEALMGINNVKAFTNEHFEINRYSNSINSVVSTAIANARFRGAFVSLLIFSVFGAIAVVIWYGAGLIKSGEFDAGKLTTFVIYTAFVGGTMAGFADMFSQLQKTIGATQRVREILREQAEDISEGEVVKTPRMKGEVQFKNIAFSYPTRSEIVVLKDFNIEAKPGQQIAIVGSSGAGKSTIAALLLKFYQPQSGNIYFDGKDSNEYDLTYLRSQMALVPQDVILFGGTIYDNILYGNPSATNEDVEMAAKRANAYNFITSFPEGFKTIVGERGIQLSGGQRQRIAIARAILKNPSILILDEATSSLDSESETLVQQALEELMKGRTSFVIAHRLSTIRNADKIIVLDKGVVAEQGNHDELMNMEKGKYKHLSNLQMDL